MKCFMYSGLQKSSRKMDILLYTTFIIVHGYNPSGQNLADSTGNLRGFWLLAEGIHVAIWVVSETRIRAEIQGKFFNRS